MESSEKPSSNGSEATNGVFKIPEKCKAGVVVNEGPDFHLEVQMVDVPQPGSTWELPLPLQLVGESLLTYETGPDQLLLRLNATGLCMSDIHYMINDTRLPPMSNFGVRSPGHEGAGIVVKVGESVKGWKLGDRAAMKPLWDVCGSCQLCWGGKENYCAGQVETGLKVAGKF